LKNLADYRIPYGGLKNGTHYFNFEVDEVFWDAFPERMVESGRVFVDLQVDKRNRITTLHFDLGGQVQVECDRCTASIGLPVTGHYKIYAKPSRDEEGESEELIVVKPDEPELDLAQLLYELIQVSLPMQKTCDEIPRSADLSDDEKPCNQAVIEQLGGMTEEAASDPRWEGLKKFKATSGKKSGSELEKDGESR
jgi:uncharacterized metal-binding protein YceD (DUF177 family)